MGSVSRSEYLSLISLRKLDARGAQQEKPSAVLCEGLSLSPGRENSDLSQSIRRHSEAIIELPFPNDPRAPPTEDDCPEPLLPPAVSPVSERVSQVHR